MDLNICIVTWYNGINYGTCIQCFALTRFLALQGYYTYVPQNFKFYYGLKHPYETIDRLISKIKKKVNPPNRARSTKELTRDIQEAYAIRIKKNENFAYAKNNIYKIKSFSDFNKMVDQTDVFIVGSDQIWNPNYVSPPYLLSMANDKHRKIAYGSSIGVSKLPSKYYSLFSKYLTRFDNIGVREETAMREIGNLIERPVVKVLDPSFLLDKEEWQKHLMVDKRVVDKDYIFCYFIGKNTQWVDDVKVFAETHSIPVYCALSESNIVPEVGILVADIGVEEFLYYIMNAKYVVTDSFHAAALSINFNVEFAVYKRFSDKDKNSQNSRITDLLKEFELSNRLVDDNNNIDLLLKHTNYEKVNVILDTLRKKSQEFLLTSIIGERENDM